MQNEILKRLEDQDAKLDQVIKSVEKTRKYILLSFIFTVATIILPLIGLLLIILWFLKTTLSAYSI